MSDFPSGKYRTIYIDPPWPERGGRQNQARSGQAQQNIFLMESE